MKRLPTALEINPYPENLDGKWAEKNFFGKSVDEAEAMIAKAPYAYTEDFTYLGPVAFIYYFESALNFLTSEASEDESDFVFSMVSTLEERLFGSYNDFDQIKDGIANYRSFCETIIKDFSKFDIDVNIYGKFQKRTQSLLDKLT
jgi:hypothetical protein